MSIEAMKQALELLKKLDRDLIIETWELAKTMGGLEQAITTEESSATQEPVAWISFEDREPPIDPAFNDPEVKSTRSVLVTNNICSKDRMGRHSHVWFASPIKNSKGEWVAFTDSSRKIEGLTHWLDPFYTHPQPKAEKQEPVCYRVRWPKMGGGYAWVMNDAPLMEEHGFINEALYTHPQPKAEKQERCQNCKSLEEQNTELDAKLAELEVNETEMLDALIAMQKIMYEEAGVRSESVDKLIAKHTNQHPKREWVGLTDEDWDEVLDDFPHIPDINDFLKIEAKLKEKNT